jgi:hypothetical protein
MRVCAGAALVLAVAAVFALTSCTPSPQTTYVAENGQEVTVDWVDYPGQAGVDSVQVLLAPSAEETREQSSAILAEIESRLSDEFGVVWENAPSGDGQRVDGDFYLSEGNGYGGDSLYVTFNALGRESLSIPTSEEDWDRIIAVIAEVTQAYGLGGLNSDGLETMGNSDEVAPLTGQSVDAYWQWGGTAYGRSQWVYASLMDVDRDETGAALKDMKGSIEYGWNPRSINISYGATILPAADRAVYVERVAPFEGLARPAATSSD